jgi:hypothetical protein
MSLGRHLTTPLTKMKARIEVVGDFEDLKKMATLLKQLNTK